MGVFNQNAKCKVYVVPLTGVEPVRSVKIEGF